MLSNVPRTNMNKKLIVEIFIFFHDFFDLTCWISERECTKMYKNVHFPQNGAKFLKSADFRKVELNAQMEFDNNFG